MEQDATQNAPSGEDAEREELLRELADSARARSSIYSMLASLYGKKLGLAEMVGFGQSLAAGVPETGNALMDEGYRDFVRGLEVCDMGAQLSLAVDYACTIGAAEADAAHAVPLESAFAPQPDGAPSARADIRRIADESKLGQAVMLPELPEDHLGFSCALMSLLCQQQAATIEIGRLDDARACVARQQEMRERHLSGWTDAYCDRLRELAQTPFYQGLAKVTAGYLRDEADFIGDSLYALDELLSPEEAPEKPAQ